MGSEPEKLRAIASEVESVMRANPMMRTVNTDWGPRVPTLHFTLDQDRLNAVGLTSSSVSLQLQFLLSGVPLTEVREDIRSVQVVGRAAGDIRLDPAKIMRLYAGRVGRATHPAVSSRDSRCAHGRYDASTS